WRSVPGSGVRLGAQVIRSAGSDRGALLPCLATLHTTQERPRAQAQGQSCLQFLRVTLRPSSRTRAPGSRRSPCRRPGSRHPPLQAYGSADRPRSEEHTSELQSRENLVCRLLLEKKKKTYR